MGTRHRGAGVIVQIKASGAYDVPEDGVRPESAPFGVIVTDIPPWIEDAMLDAKRRRDFGHDSELGAPRGQRSGSPAPGLSPPAVPKIKVASGELPHPYVGN